MSNDVQFPENIRQALQPDAKKETKMLLAQGLLPMPPAQLMEALRILYQDPDHEIRATSKTTVEKMPETIVVNIAQNSKVPETLSLIAELRSDSENIMEKILINSNSSDETFVQVSPFASEKLATLIANNQVRILRTPKIAENLKKNPKMLQSETDKMVSFLKMNGIVLEGESPELSLSEIEAILKLGDEEIPEEFIEDSKESFSEEKKLSIYQYVQSINTGQKIKLALKGNKEARSLLIKDSNKVVSVGVIKNPRITEGEVLNVCLNRSINEEILRIVCNKADWVKHYSIQLALSSNPKTPFAQALRFTKMLSENDLKKLSTNKNAAAQVQRVAKQLYMQKRK